MDLTLDNLKLQLNIELLFLEDNTILQSCLDTATLATYNFLDVPSGTTISGNTTINAAIILLAANYYSNRNMINFANAQEMPYTFKFLLSPYKSITIV